MSTQTYVDRIIAKFGSLSATARALGHENPTTVQGWKERGFIPARQQLRVLEAGRALQNPVTPDDFFDTAPASPDDTKPATARLEATQ